MDKPKFSEKEIDELDNLNMRMGKQFRLYEIIEFLKQKFNYSDVNTHIIELRKEFQQRDAKLQEKSESEFPDSTLHNTLMKRLDWTEKHSSK